MVISICEDKKSLGMNAARKGALCIAETIKKKGEANVAFVSGLSQIETLKNLVREDVDWSCVNVFLLDEYVGIDRKEKTSSSLFIREHLISKVSSLKSFHEINPDEKNMHSTVRELNAVMKDHPLDVSFICIGENGHLAFNDPPADFDTEDAYIIVELEARSRRQQVNEGWFKKVADVPKKAITMSINEILSSEHLIISCPEQRKAKAVAMALFDDITPLSPAAAVKRGKDTHLFLDRQSSCLIFSDKRTI